MNKAISISCKNKVCVKTETRTSFYKSLVISVISCVVSALVLTLSILSKSEASYDIYSGFNGVQLLAAMVNGGSLSFFVDEIGELFILLPKNVNIMLAAIVIMQLLLTAYQIAKTIILIKTQNRKLEIIGGALLISWGILCWVAYISLMLIKTVTTDFDGATIEFYKACEPSVMLIILGIVSIIGGIIELKIDKAQIKQIVHHVPVYLFMAIPLILIAIFNIYPILLQTVLSFKEYNLADGIYNSPWVGLKHFIFIFTDAKMIGVIGNTLFISLLRLVAGTIPPLILSIFLYDLTKKRTKSVVQNIVYIPHFFSWVIIYAITYAFFNEEGIFNAIFGFDKNLMFDKAWFIPIVIFTAIWKELGWGTILYLAALSSVDTELFDAAKIDGAGPVQRIFKITLPSILPIIIYLTIMSLGNILKGAGGEQLLLFASANTRPQAMVIDTWLYWKSLGELQYSLGAAVSFFQAAIGMILVLVCNKLSKKATGIGMW